VSVDPLESRLVGQQQHWPDPLDGPLQVRVRMLLERPVGAHGGEEKQAHTHQVVCKPKEGDRLLAESRGSLWRIRSSRIQDSPPQAPAK